MFDRLDDTIVAISSPTGVGVRGVIRLSGPEAFSIAARVFVLDDGTALADAGGHRRLFGSVLIPDVGAIPGEAYAFRAPASYTRQDVVELHLIGSPPVLAMVLEALTDAGARPAEPGEFTARAYFAGAMDLTRVEGVAAVIHARNDSQLRASEALLHGQLSRRTTALRDELADLLALIEAQIDFVEEPIEFVSRDDVARTIERVSAEVESLVRNAPSVERLEALPEVVLAGRPNAGKSTLFNRLTSMDRVIQSSTAGTTRDVITAPLSLPEGEVALMDSAGLCDAAGDGCLGGTTELDGPAQAMSRRSIARADLVLLVVDATDEPAAAFDAIRPTLRDTAVLTVLNKMDAIPAEQRAGIAETVTQSGPIVSVSAKTGEGMDRLKTEIAERVFAVGESHSSDVLALSNRQRSALNDAHEALIRAKEVIDAASSTSDRAELLALEVREAMNMLSLLVGEVSTEEMLGRIFSRFCIGK